MLDGWLKLGLRLSYKISEQYKQTYDYSKASYVRVQMFKDQDIRKNVASNASTDVFGIPTMYTIHFLPNASPKDVKTMVNSD